MAFHQWDFSVFLRHDPGPTAEALLHHREGLPAYPIAVHGWRENVRPAQHIAGLLYAVGVPPPWHSVVEPREGLQAEMVVPRSDAARASGRILRLEHNKMTIFTRGWAVEERWLDREKPGWGVALEVRGQLSETSFLCLTLRPYDEQWQSVGEPTDVKFGPGVSTTQWHVLQQFPSLPLETRFVVVTLWCAHQQEGDWVELGEPYTVLLEN
jgi:hypothetical protein